MSCRSWEIGGGRRLMGDEPFWKSKPLEAMSQAEWESLCDGCGRCCLIKLIEDETDRTYFTDVACHMLDQHKLPLLRLRRPQNGTVPDCVSLTPEGFAHDRLVCRRPAPIGSSPKVRNSIGGIRWCQATLTSCTRSGFRCAEKSPRATRRSGRASGRPSRALADAGARAAERKKS